MNVVPFFLPNRRSFGDHRYNGPSCWHVAQHNLKILFIWQKKKNNQKNKQNKKWSLNCIHCTFSFFILHFVSSCSSVLLLLIASAYFYCTWWNCCVLHTIQTQKTPQLTRQEIRLIYTQCLQQLISPSNLKVRCQCRPCVNGNHQMRTKCEHWFSRQSPQNHIPQSSNVVTSSSHSPQSRQQWASSSGNYIHCNLICAGYIFIRFNIFSVGIFGPQYN